MIVKSNVVNEPVVPFLWIIFCNIALDLIMYEDE